MHARTLALPLSLVVLAVAPFAQATVLEVAFDGSGDHSTIQAAVDAASDGDTIYVRDGDYAPFVVDGKALTILGEDQARVASSPFTPGLPAVRVIGLAAGQVVTIRDIDGLTTGSEDFDYALRVQNCAGTVTFEECWFANLNGRCAEITGSDHVVFRDCTIDALEPAYNAFNDEYLARTGLGVFSSTVELHDCSVWGTRGQDSFGTIFGIYDAIRGGAAVYLQNSTLLAVGTRLVGGHGGAGIQAVCSAGGDGAAAVVAVGTSSLTAQDTIFTPGPGGLGSCGLADGTDAPALDLGGAPFTLLPGVARTLDTQSPVEEATSVTLRVAGATGDLPLLVIGLGATPAVHVPQVPVAVTTAPPYSFLALPTVDALGESSLTVGLPPLAAGTSHARFVAQALVVPLAEPLQLTAASTTTMLPAGF